MIILLRLLFSIIIVSMVAVTTWAGSQQSLSAFAHSATFREPWVIATLFDAYWAFITFFVWVAWKESGAVARLLWFVSIVLLGNIAMSAYMLAQLFAVRTTAPLAEVFTRREPGRLALPIVLTAIAVGVYLLA